ncbi:unnamed protein product, partial [Amoebophrya sp. A120]|eukprot:GSA120T00015586001.1
MNTRKVLVVEVVLVPVSLPSHIKRDHLPRCPPSRPRHLCGPTLRILCNWRTETRSPIVGLFGMTR